MGHRGRRGAHARHASLVALAACAGFGTTTRGARADPPDARLHADDVTLEPESQAVSLRGHVDVEADPFHLTSDALRVTRTPRGLHIEGDGRVAFCPCLGEPVSLVFRGATVAPPGDLFLEQPRLEVGAVPIFWLPVFWLRSSTRAGFLPPEVAYRGADGFFLGDGFHLPWGPAEAEAGLDLRAGGYFQGGVAVESTLRTPSSVTTVRWDDLHQSGLGVDARGALVPRSATGSSLAWDADLLRGARGVASTTDLDAAARVYDRAAAEGAWRPGGGWVFAAGVWGESARGTGLGELDAAGPVVRARNGGALGDAGAYDATVEGGSVTGAGLAAMSYGRADAGALLATRWGPVGASVALRGGAGVAAQAQTRGDEEAGSLRARLALPLARAFASSEPNDPWRHRVEPEVEVGGLASRGDALAGDVTSPGGVRGLAWVADAGVKTALGQWAGRRGLELGGDVGGVGGDSRPASLVVRWRAAASAPTFGLGGEGAGVAGPAGGWGHAVTARARVGSTRSLSVSVLVAGRDGVDPVVARALTDAPLAASSGFLASSGWTSGARITLPLTPFVTARGGVDGDLTRERLVAARGSLEVHDHCECVAVRLSAAERLGRDGVDVWLSVDLVPRR